MINTLEQALEIIKSQPTKNLSTQTISIDNLQGRILAEDILATLNQPPFNRSPLDGYAVNHSDIQSATKENPAVLKVIDTVYAGGFSTATWSKGSVVRIMTGAPIPEGFDCIIRQEDTNYGETTVEIYQSLGEYDNFCFAGEDTKTGDKLIQKHTKLNYIHAGILASQGITSVKVFSQPSVLLITTGDELETLENPLSGGKIYNTNLYTLKARLASLMMDTTALSFGDDYQLMADYIKENHHRYHCIITTGGVSVGVKDIIHNVIEELSGQILFYKVKLKPGTPALFWKYENTPILSLSGNPFAAFATFELLGRTLLSCVSKDSSIMPQWSVAKVRGTFLKKTSTRRFLRACCKDGVVSLDIDNHSSGSFSSTSYCNCLIDILENVELQDNDTVKIVKF